MTIKTILVPMNGPKAAERLLKFAVPLARRFDAHLIGLHVAEAIVVYSDFAMIPPAAEIDQVSEGQAKRAEEIEAVFRKATEGEDFGAEWRFMRTEATTASDRIIEQARTTDLVIMAQPDPDAPSASEAVALERAIRKSGRPILVLPYAGTFDSVGSHVMIGWSATRESARAAHDAIPLMAPGAKATIITAQTASELDGEAMATAKELALTYDRHGIKAEVAERVVNGVAVGDILLNEAFERGADMIVTGAFGHSRIYDFVIGATTTRLIESMTAPVLFST